MQTEPVLSPREEWRLVLWMTTHPRALSEDTTSGQGMRPAPPHRPTPLAYGLGLAVGMLVMVLRKALE